MKATMAVLISIAMCIFLLGCAENYTVTPDLEEQNLKSAKKPMAKLEGTTYTPFTFTPPTFWNGTLDFGDHGKYSITFFSLVEPRGYSQASPFEEDFIVYYEGTDYNEPGNVVMKGWNKGVVTLKNNLPDPASFLANGKILEAFGPMAEWEGRTMHIRGIVVYNAETGLPDYAKAYFRIN